MGARTVDRHDRLRLIRNTANVAPAGMACVRGARGRDFAKTPSRSQPSRAARFCLPWESGRSSAGGTPRPARRRLS